MPPSAASTYDSSAPKAMQPGGWSRPKSLSVQPVSRSTRGGGDSPSTESGSIKLIVDEETDAIVTEAPLIFPPAASDEENGLVPPPQDAEDEFPLMPARQAAAKIVELDVAEFLAELEHTPAPIKAQTRLEPLPVPVAASSSVLHTPRSTVSSSMTPWPPNGVDHGIAINPGPTGTGNRLEALPIPSTPWNTGRIGSPNPPGWNSMNFWAGQNSDWGGRQFR